MTGLLNRKIKAILIDITGVLYESGAAKAIPGSIDAIAYLKKRGIPHLFVTNESQAGREGLAAKLNRIGYQISPEQIFSPGPACRAYIETHQLRPHLLVYPDIKCEFEGLNQDNPNCVVIGDAANYFTYEAVNKTFQVLMAMEKPLILTMGKGKYYQEKEELTLDLGAYTVGLEYACDTKAIVLGKPAEDYFLSALKVLNVPPENAVMIGDDIAGDVAGAQACGIAGLLVRSGKYRRERDENHASIKPDSIVNNLQAAVQLIENNL